MKILKSIGLYFVYPFMMFLLGIYAHILYLEAFYPNKYSMIQEENILNSTTYPVTNISEMITNYETKYIVLEQDARTGEVSTLELSIPDQYLGINREMMENILQEYLKSPSLEDEEKGIIDIQLESFSTNEVRVRKLYESLQDDLGYYLMVQDGKIVVMEKDKETIYLTTDIYAEALSDSLKQELIQGKFINSIEELYGFLESYTS